MTTRLPFTQASVRRAIAAARNAGLRVTGIGPDGTVLVDDGDKPVVVVPDSPPPSQTARVSSKWEDAEA
jgi:hypothetical protein